MADEEGNQPQPLNPGSQTVLTSWFPEKTLWSELIGQTSEEAQRKILEVMPGAVIQVVPPEHSVTMDYRTDRVRIYTDSAGKVASEPIIG